MLKARFIRISCVLSFSLISACGMLHEKETTPSSVKQSMSSSSDCEMPEMKALTNFRGQVQMTEANAWVSCFRKTIEKSFGEVHGGEADAVSAKELYRISSRGLISLPLKTSEQFEGLGGFMSLLNPEGHPAVTKAQALALADLIKDALPLVEEYQNSDRNDVNRDKALALLKRALVLFPGKGEFSATHVKELSSLLDDESMRSKIAAAFPAIRLIFRDAINEDGETRLAGSSFRELIQMAINAIEIFKDVPSEDALGNTARHFVSKHEDKILKAVDVIKTYFHQPKFTALKAREARTLMVDGLGNTAGFTEDALLLARRFLGEPDVDQAVSVRLLFPFLDDVASLTKDFKTLETAFPGGTREHTRSELLAMNDPLLTSIALKSHFYVSSGMSAGGVDPLVKRKDIPINVDSSMETVTLRYLFKKLFVAFGSPGHIDPVKGIYIPKKALSAEEERDAKNLARLFLKFANSLSHTEDEQHKNSTSDITIDDEFTVKAESVYRIMGLVGDRWFLDGNDDGYLNPEEFFSVISLFMEATRYTSFEGRYYKSNEMDYWKSPVFPRTDFIKNLLATTPVNQLRNSPYEPLESSILKMKDPSSLFHALMSRSDDPVDAYDIGGGGYSYSESTQTYAAPKKKLKDWLEGSAMVPANAILGLLDRAFLKCDLNDDDQLSWEELDCAAELLSGGMYHVSESGAVNLDPGVHDGVIILSKLVYDPEIDPASGEFEKRLKELPRQVFKLFLSQGNAQVTLDQATLDSLSFTPTDLIPAVVLTQRPELTAIYLAEVNQAFGDCDANHDGTYAGTELDCVFDHAATKWLSFIRTPDVRAQIQTLIPFATPAQIEAVLSAPDFKAWFVYLTKGVLPISKVATATSILDALESAIRRSCPLGMEVVEGQCLQPSP